MRILKLTRQLIFPLLTLSLLYGCGSTPTEKVQLKQPSSISGWLALANTSSADKRPQYQLNAANLAILQHNWSQAGEILAQIQPATASQQNSLWLFLAEVALVEQKHADANRDLANLNPQTLSTERFLRWLAVKQQLLITDADFHAAATLLATHFERFTPEQQQLIAQQIWHYLDSDDSESQSLILAPWQQLHQTMQQADSARALQQGLKRWHIRHPQHPAMLAVNPQLLTLLTTEYTPPNQIALLLPLTGKYHKAGKAIRDGILHAWFGMREQMPAVRVYDTNSTSISALYQQAIDDGADAVIGPLLKESVASLLTTTEPTVPTLILNRNQEQQANQQLVFFALPPEAEGRQTASWLQRQGVNHPLLLTTGGNGNQRLIDGFTGYHTSQTQPHTAAIQSAPFTLHQLGASQTFQKQIELALGITDSKARFAQLKTLVGTKLKSQPRSRRDLDAVYIAASPSDSRLIKSFIDVTVSPYAGQLPVYIASRGHAGYRNELEGAIIGDLAINISSDNAELKQQILALHPGWKASDLRLFALGYDAMQLVDQIALVHYLPHLSLRGLTGKLSVSEQGNIEVDMPWAKYHNGSLKKVEQPL